MACPYFLPTETFAAIGWPHRARLPLGEGWRGMCTAAGQENITPAADELTNFCNLGYARSCPRLPRERPWDAVRFSVARDKDGLIALLYVCEKDYRPAEHGTLEYDCGADRWGSTHRDLRIQKMAQCYLEIYLLRRQKSAAQSAT
jgi:hypothetical protein